MPMFFHFSQQASTLPLNQNDFVHQKDNNNKMKEKFVAARRALLAYIVHLFSLHQEPDYSPASHHHHPSLRSSVSLRLPSLRILDEILRGYSSSVKCITQFTTLVFSQQSKSIIRCLND
eukprot:GDKJ01026081.1.p1 GENE.GDKJ01026081.1~~GDKJ01026081.1.p1  ORF type:complete len:119 (+),score=22.07 GDKJ01026081.1:842-1198(+)